MHRSKDRIGVYVCACMAMVLISMSLDAQSASPKLILGSSPVPELKFVTFDGQKFPFLDEAFQLMPEIQPLRSVSFVLVNQTSRPIIGVAVKLLLVDQGGKTSLRMMASHSFIAPGFQPIADVGEGVLLAPPLSFVKESVMRGPGKIVYPPPKSLVDLVSAAVEVHADIDCIIFSDGEVVGDDSSQMQADIQARKTAANSVIRRVYASVSGMLSSTAQQKASPATEQFPLTQITDVINGIPDRLPPAHMISQNLRQVKPPRPGDAAGKHDFEFSNRLLQTAHFKATFEYIRSIPEPPVFYRKTGQPQ